MNDSDVTKRLEEAAKRKAAKERQDDAVRACSRILEEIKPEERMVALCTMKALLILEISGGDMTKAERVFVAAESMVNQMISDIFHVQMAMGTKH